jgi:hypothetical protein
MISEKGAEEIFISKKEEVGGKWRKLRDEDYLNIYLHFIKR